MRKNFLILMLMALLPLAGWAQGVDISSFPFTIGNVSYVYSGGTPSITPKVTNNTLSTPADLTLGTDYELVYYKDGAKITAATVKNVGTYSVTAKAKGDAYTGETAPVEFNITKKALTVKYNSETTITLTKAYGAANPALDQSKISYEGFIGSEGDTEAKRAALISGTMSYTLAKENATNVDADNFIDGVTAGQTMTISGLDATNYSFTYPTGTVKITQIALAATPDEIPADGKNYFTYEKNAGTLTYNGSAQTASYTIVYHDAQGNTHNLAVSTGTSGDKVKDYKLTYAYKATAADTYGTVGDAHTNAGYYRPTINAEKKGNYKGNVTITDADDNLDFEIGKANVYVYVEDKTKVYDGEPFSTTYAAGMVTFAGKKGTVEPDKITIAYENTDLGEADKKVVNKFTMVPVVADDSNLRTNHNVTILNTGKWEIKPRPIKVTAKEKQVTYGDPAPTFKNTETFITLEAKGTDRGLVNGTSDTGYEAEKNLILSALTIGLNGTYTDVNEEGYKNAIVVAVDPEKADDVANYDIQPVAGTYKIVGAAYTIIAKNKTITYGNEYALTDFVYVTNGADVAEGQTVEFKLQKDGKDLTALPKDAGSYDILIVEKDTYLPTGYTLPITYVPGTLTIEPKALTISMAEQTLLVGDKKDALLADKVSFLDADGEDGIVEGDVLGFALSFNTGSGTGQIATDKFTDSDAEKDLAAGAVGSYSAGVKIDAVASTTAKPNQNANYTIDWTKTGALTVLTNTGLALKSNDGDITNVNKLDTKAISGITIDLSARNSQKLPATATANRVWDAKQWNTLVLPFDITVAELSTAFGYAIVNVVNPDKTTTDNVQFKLEMDEIKANTPFLIKTSKKLIDATNGITTDGVITFSGSHTVAKPTAAQIAGVAAGLDYKFVPVYETIEVDNTKSSYRFLLGNSEKWAYITETSENTWNLVPFSAYVDLSASAAPELVTFTMEEIDGSVTTVKAIESGLAQGAAAYAAEGWYTLNGVKLNAAPAQKGVYIKDGKKVVIK